MKKRINDWVDANKGEVIEFLQSIIRIPSVTGDEAEIQSYLTDFWNKECLETDLFVPDLEELKAHPAYVPVDVPNYDNRPNLLVKLPGNGGGRSLLFNGHVDVIPEGAAENWEHNPWSAEISDNKLYGRGASDMKSGVAAMTMAVLAIKRMGLKLKGDVILEYVMDEELSGNGTLACVMRGIKADAGICCETSSMCVQPGSIGRIWFEIQIKGKAAGIQTRFEGVSGIELGYFVTQLVSEYEKQRLETIRHPLYPNILESIPCMIGVFTSGTYASAFPDECVLKGSIATVPSEDSNSVKEDFRRYIVDKSKTNLWLAEHPPVVNYTGYFADPSEIPADSKIVQLLAANYEDFCSETAVISGRQGAADTRFLNTWGGTPTVIFGPGKTEQMHANNEWVDLSDYLDSIRILIATIIDWCGLEEE